MAKTNMKPLVVYFDEDETKTLIRVTDWEKKGLATYKIDLVGLCEFGCTYCSSNTNPWHRTKSRAHRALIEGQVGPGIDRFNTPALTYHYQDVLSILSAELDQKTRTKGRAYGEGNVLSFGNLTDNFSPSLVKDGITEAVLRMLVERTSFRIRILTKNSIVGSKKWIDILKEFGDRVVVGLSIGTNNDEWASKVEIGTSKPTARIRAHRRLQDAGIPTFGMLCPVFPHAVEELDDLIDAIRPEQCEHVWAEPYNDRDNWRRIVADTETAEVLERLFTSRAAWSEYAADLYQRLLRASESGWTNKLIYMLYEAKIPEDCAPLFGDLTGIYLQSLGDDGRSTNPAFAKLQRPDADVPEAAFDAKSDKVAQLSPGKKAWETRRRNAKANDASAWVESQLSQTQVQPLRISAKDWLGIWTLERAMEDGFWDVPTLMDRLLWIRPDDDLVEEAGRIADKHGISRDSTPPEYQRVMISERLSSRQLVLYAALQDFDPEDETADSSIKLVLRCHALAACAA